MNDQFDLIAVGDSAVNNFIRLKDAHLTCDIKKESCQICLNFADKVPYENSYYQAGAGNSANIAVGLSKLGLKTALVSNVGNDQDGKNCLAVLNASGVNTDFVAIDEKTPTNYHYVLWYENDRTILVKHEKYAYQLPAINPPKWLYLSSIGEDAEEYHQQISAWLAEHPETKLAFQPGTFQIKLGVEKLRDIYSRAEILFCNKGEAKRILQTETDDVIELMQSLAKLGPKSIVITDGAQGAYALTDGQLWQIPASPTTVSPLELTGAGDSFASAFLTAIINGKPVSEALAWGTINSASVIQQVGSQAGLLNREQLEKILAKMPEEYKAKQI